MVEIKLFKSQYRIKRLILICSGFILLGIWLLSRDVSSFAVWFSICFFGLGCGIGLYQLFDKRPQILITEASIYDRSLKIEAIPWNAIINAYPRSIYKQQFICLELIESFKPLAKKGKLVNFTSKLNEALNFEAININLSQIDVNESLLTDLINELSKAEIEERLTLLKEFKKQVM